MKRRDLSVAPAPVLDRSLGAIAALAVAALTLASARSAIAVINVPNHAEMTRVVAPFTASPTTAWPVTNGPVSLIATCTTGGRKGIGAVSACYSTTDADKRLVWVGQRNSGVSVSGDTTALNQDIVNVGNGINDVVIQTAGPAANTPSHFKIQNNTDDDTTTVVIQLIW